MTVDDAVDFFAAIPKIARKVQTIKDVGLGYVTWDNQQQPSQVVKHNV